MVQAVRPRKQSEAMQNFSSIKLVLIAPFLMVALLYPGIAGIALAGETDFAQTNLVQPVIDLDKCVDGDALDYSSCCNGQTCGSCHAVVLYISIIINSSGETTASGKLVPHLQIDNKPHHKPPRIS